MKYNFSAFDYKNMWEGFYEEHGKQFFMREYYKNGVCKPYRFVKNLMDDYKEEYGKNLIGKSGYLDVEEHYKD